MCLYGLCRVSGVIYLYIQDELRVEGRLHSNGEMGSDSKAGGGAGGSLYISVNHLDGTGSIEATGGAGKIYDMYTPTVGWLYYGVFFFML